MHPKPTRMDLLCGAATICLLAIVLPGCRNLYRKGPAPSDVITCRHKWQQGLDAVQRGRWEDAELLFSAAVTTCPNDERARQYLADTLWHRGARDQATLQMQEAVTLSGGDPTLLIRLGEMYLSQGKSEEASTYASQALAQQPNLADGWALRGNIHGNRGNIDAALADYHRALSIQPNMPRIQFALAKIDFRRNRPQHALTTLHTLIDGTAPSELPSEVIYLEGMILKSLGRYEDAARSFRLVAQTGQPGAQLFYELADAEMHSGRMESAKRAAQVALAWDADHEPTRRLLGSLARSRDRMAATISRLPQ